MARDDYRDAWGVIDDEGLKVRTVSDTRRAAIINWLVTEAGVLITSFHSDDQINAIWDAKCGDALVRPVRIYVQ
jgi:hypothetical protein